VAPAAGGGARGSTLQLGDPATIAERTGCRWSRTSGRATWPRAGTARRWCRGWTGLLFAFPDRARALQNIGGIGNVSWVPPRGSAEPVFAFDTGPGNALMDAAVEIATAGGTYDRDGRLAAQGRWTGAAGRSCSPPLLRAGAAEVHGARTFGRPFVERLVDAVEPEGDRDWLDLVATLTELTARSHRRTPTSAGCSRAGWRRWC
jgi:anhydro-N-acetylmuramic acid kinase